MLSFFNKIGESVTKIMGETEIGVESFSNKELEDSKNLLDKNPLSHLLPYESFDESTALFINKNSIGFTIEAVPLVGSDETCQKEIHSIFEEILEEGASLQFFLWADHRIDPFLNKWRDSRKEASEILREISEKRCAFFRDQNTHSTRIFRFILSYSVPLSGDVKQSQVESLLEKRDRLLKTLKTMTNAFMWTPKQFLQTVGGLVNFNPSSNMQKREWNPLQSLSSQLTTGGSVEVNENYLGWKNEETTHFKSFRVLDYPQNWSLQAMQLLIGDTFRDSYRINQPFYIHYGVHCPKQAKAEAGFWRRSQLIENQGKSNLLMRMIPDLADELNECDYIRRSLKQGSRFVWTQLSAGLWASQDKINQSEQTLKSIFRNNNFNIADNRCIHLPQFISSLPMTWSEYAEDLKNLDALKTTITPECSNFVPIQGEWRGTRTPGMLMVGRRGQLMNWNPFDNNSGNYNAVVVGRSGSGKSVFMQDMLASGLGTGYRVYVLEVGRSFEKMNDILGGQSVEFTKESNICLNPFTLISTEDEEERNTSFSLLKSVISCMAAPTKGTSDYENAIIEKAIFHAWESKKTNATITDISNWLQNQNDERARSIGTMLTPYSKNGVYAKYFEGKNNVNFSNQMVLIELEELKEKKDLQSVVMQLFIMNITNQAFHGDRKTPFYICIDEAWDLLKAKQTESFIETLARRLRKYNGSLIIGTQSVEDFYSTPGAKAAYENSDWMCLLSQKKSSIKQLSKSGKLEIDDSKIMALESVTTKHGEYSEVMIINGEGNFTINRLILEPFSQLLYSTKAQEYYQIQELKKRGMTTTQAINHMIRSKGD